MCALRSYHTTGSGRFIACCYHQMVRNHQKQSTQLRVLHSKRVYWFCSNSCNTLLDAKIGKCTNTECSIGNGIEEGEPETSFDIRVMLTDQTGTLVGCHLKGHIAEAILGCTVLLKHSKTYCMVLKCFVLY